MSTIKQLSIFIENKKGELGVIAKLLCSNSVSLQTINLVDSSEFGLIRTVVDDIEKAKQVLDEAGFSYKVTEVIAVESDDYVGSFNELVNKFIDNGIDIQYTYTINRTPKGIFIFRVKDGELTKTVKLLQESNTKLLEKI